jgi:DNA-directed RNA polymerase specialized sigma24 family protein
MAARKQPIPSRSAGGAARKQPAARAGGAGNTAASRVAPASEQDALRTLVERNYSTLREIARRKLHRSPLAKTMSPTSLVAESVVRLMRQRALPSTAPHLSGLATILMAQALSDRAKGRLAAKRNRGAKMLELGTDVPKDRRLGRSGEDAAAAARKSSRQAELIQQMELLGRQHPRRMEVVTLHLVLGIALPEVARMLAISERTAFRELAAGRAALAAALGSGLEGPRHGS